MSNSNAPSLASKIIARTSVTIVALTMLSAVPAFGGYPFERANPPLILALDGIVPQAILRVLFPNDFLLGRIEAPYLGTKLSEAWGIDVCSFSATHTCSITTIPWSGLLGETMQLETYRIQTREVVRSLVNRDIQIARL